METDQTESQSPEVQTQPSKSSNSMPVIGVVIALLIIGGVFFFKTMKTQNTTDSMAVTETQEPESVVVPTGEVKEIIVTGGNFKYDTSEISVNLGDTVRITFKNSEGTHDFVLDEFNIRTDIVNAGEEETIEFLADKLGTFEYYCSVGTHRQMGMKGNLIVLGSAT